VNAIKIEVTAQFTPENVFATWGVYPIGTTKRGDQNDSKLANQLPA
jgi:hypothetical protein